MYEGRILEALEEQNNILKQQLREQKMINQQMFQLLQQISMALGLNGQVMNQPAQQSQEHEERESLGAVFL